MQFVFLGFENPQFGLEEMRKITWSREIVGTAFLIPLFLAADGTVMSGFPRDTRAYAVGIESKAVDPNAKEACVSIHSCLCDWYSRKWSDVPHDSLTPLPRKALDAISDKYIAQCEAAVKAKADDADAWLALGNAQLFRRRWKAARAAYQRAIPLFKRKGLSLLQCHYHLAEVHFAEGRTEEAVAELQRGIGLGLWEVWSGQTNWPRLARDAADYLSGRAADYYEMPRDTGCKPFPEPQKAEYSEAFSSVRKVSVELKGVEQNDARIRLLEAKLRRFGSKIDFSGGAGSVFRLRIGLLNRAPVDRPEGYSLSVGESGGTILARDAQGVLWGIVSFLQLVDRKNLVVRRCRIDDWPDTARRGYFGMFWAGCAEFTVFNKMNSVVLQEHPLMAGEDSPINVYLCETLAKEFRSLGLQLDYDISRWTHWRGWPYVWRCYLGMQADICMKFAAMGAGVYYPNDDMRYYPNVLRQEDLAGGKRPSDFDAQHILELYQMVKKDYPDFHLVYCPPFYWGPTSGHSYPDDREKYLRSLRVLPPEVDICWTGPAVKGIVKTKEQTQWFTDLTGHKPTVFQNATAPHHQYSYVVDRTPWNDWHHPGFFENDIAAFMKNARMPTECPQTTTLADCLWNVKGYDAERSIRRGIAQYCGEKFFETLDRVADDLSYFDKYKYGEITPEAANEDLREMEARIARIDAATAEAEQLIGGQFMLDCGHWMHAKRLVHRVLDETKKLQSKVVVGKKKLPEPGAEPDEDSVVDDL